jgi:O-antigen/teichoic acid export membrane protein
MAQILTPGDFGASQALITILTQAGSIFAGLSLLTIYLVKTTSSNNISNLIDIMQKVVVSVLIFATAILLVFHSHISTFLNLADNFNLIIVAVDLIVSIPFVISYGYLLAQKRFIAAALLQIAVVTLKLLIGIILAQQFTIFGALAGVGMGYIAGMGIFWLICTAKGIKAWGHNIFISYNIPSIKEISLLKPYRLMISSTLFVSTCLVIYPSFDVIIARHYLDAYSSGLYAAASTLSSAILFACLPIVNILIPNLDIKSIRASMFKIKKTIIYVLSISALGLTVLSLIPSTLLLMFGRDYTAFADILWVFGMNMLFLCLLTIFLQVIVLFRPIAGVCIALLCLAGILIVSTVFNSTAMNIIGSISSVYLAATLVSISYFAFHARKSPVSAIS